MQELVITAVGPDRPGLVGGLTGRLLECSANVADSRMINLRGQFAVILLAEVPENSVERVQEQMLLLAEELGLTITFRGNAADEDPWPTTVGVPYRLRTYAMDQPGIVHKISDLLQKSGVNVEELETRAAPRPQTGAPLFSMEMLITVPPALQVKELRDSLHTLCDALNCDVELQQVTFNR